MKKCVLAFNRRTHAGGEYIESGQPVAVIESNVPWDTLIASLHRGELVEVACEQVEEPELPAATAKQESQPAENSQPGEADIDIPGQPEVEKQQAAKTEKAADGGTALTETKMANNLVGLLASGGISTVEELNDYVSSGGDLSEIDGIGTANAKRIAAWLESNKPS